MSLNRSELHTVLPDSRTRQELAELLRKDYLASIEEHARIAVSTTPEQDKYFLGMAAARRELIAGLLAESSEESPDSTSGYEDI